MLFFFFFLIFFFVQAEDGIRDLVRSRGLGDVYKRQASVYRTVRTFPERRATMAMTTPRMMYGRWIAPVKVTQFPCCLLYTSDAADERSSVDLGGRRIIKKKKKVKEELYTTQELKLVEGNKQR